METPNDISAGDVRVPPLQEAPAPAPFLETPLTPAQLRRKVRIWCAVILAVTLPLIVVAYILQPSPTGTGSHEKLGLPPCGFYAATGIPCATCGCTTAVTHIVRGQILSGLITQPFGAAFGIVTVMAALLALVGVVTGRWHGPTPFWLGWHWKGILASGLTLLLVAWAYKIMFVKTAHGW